MCGNAIISDFIPTPASWRVTAEHLWSGKPKRGKRLMVGVQEEGKADFQGFNNDESEEDEFDTMRFSFGSKSIISREGSMTKSVNFNGPAAKSAKRKKKSVRRNPTMPMGQVGS
ncbi:hypothetical protein C4D60_Mb02t22600 [Musa balbisiana]|uniref:Uncharacterized protein n=1 Tax=Musa balbisiana TaxID=52838 RepID=A0A4S8ICM5_MUSBA|nr:hypothetical protein C4D60_Mb02t22600 [Musa balbisiana]